MSSICQIDVNGVIQALQICGITTDPATGTTVKTKTDAEISQCLCLPATLSIFNSVTTDCASTPAAATLIQDVQKLTASCSAGSSTSIPAACTTSLNNAVSVSNSCGLTIDVNAGTATVAAGSTQAQVATCLCAHTSALTQVTTTCASVSSLSSLNSSLTTLVNDCSAAGATTNPVTGTNVPAACSQALQNMLTTASNCGVTINTTTGATTITPGTTNAQLTSCLCSPNNVNVFNTVTTACSTVPSFNQLGPSLKSALAQCPSPGGPIVSQVGVATANPTAKSSSVQNMCSIAAMAFVAIAF